MTSVAVPSWPVACERHGMFALTHVREEAAAGEAPERQFAGAFAELERRLNDMELTPGDIGRLTVFTPDRSQRSYINEPWLAMFDTDDRPARRTTHLPLDPGVAVEMEVVGRRGGGRRPIEIDGVRHRDPLPMGAVIGERLWSSAIVPDRPGGGAPQGIAAIHQAFDNLQALVEAAGGSLSNVSNLWVYLGRWDCHDDMVDRWVETFPDADRRPSRKTYFYPDVEVQLQCEAVLTAQPVTLELPGMAHRDPIPLAAMAGRSLVSSGVDGRDLATGLFPRHVGPQAAQALRNVGDLLGRASLGASDVMQMVGLVGRRRYIDEVDAAWREVFGAGAKAPALQLMELGLPARDMLVQFIVRAEAAG